MGAESLTQILITGLGIAFIVLFILVVFLVVTIIKKKSKETKKVDIKLKEEKISSNIIQTNSYTSDNIKKFLDFDEIKDNMIVQNKGKRLVMVVQCQGINYDLMSSMEKVSVEKGFVQFLNSLTRPVQLYIQSRKVNLEESVQNYNKRLKEIEVKYNKARIQYEQAQKNEDISKQQFDMIRFEYIRLKNLFDYTKDIINNTEKMSLNKNILTKNYFIAISYMPEDNEDLFGKDELLDMAFSELYTNAQSLLRVLAVCGITGRILNSTELAELLYIAYNRDSSEVYGIDKAIRAGYDSLYTTAPDVLEKKIQELDKLIKNRAMELANNTIEEVTLKSKRKKELEEKENNLELLIQNMAKLMIEENEGYIEKEIVQEALQVIEEKKIEKTKKTRAKKGA